MIPKAFTSFVNHLLGQQSWARARLCAHAGRRIRLQAGPAIPDLRLSILESGLLALLPDGDEADLLVSIRPAAMPGLLMRNDKALQHVELSGNAALAAVVQDLVARLEWDPEEDLSRIVGDVAAHRIACAGRDLLAWQRDALQRTAGNFAEYLTEENAMLVRRSEFDRFVRDLEVLDRDQAGVEIRVSALMNRADGARDLT